MFLLMDHLNLSSIGIKPITHKALRGLAMTNQSIFTRFTHHLLGNPDAKKNMASPLKDHPQIPFIIDTLSRFEQHHLVLSSTQAEKINHALMESVAQHLSTDHIPKTLYNCDFVYFDIHQLALSLISKEQIEVDFHMLCDELRANNKRIILVINELDLFLQNNISETLVHFDHAIKTILFDDSWRLIFFTQKKNPIYPPQFNRLFSTISVAAPTTTESLALLKSHRASLENFHHVIISDETFTSAHSLSTHYLAGESCFNNALNLLDSGAARASTFERNEQTGHKPIVTSHILTQIIANWTHIPLAHLQNNKFQANKFIDALSKHVFGQDDSINFIASILQNACVKLQEKNGPFCNFLFVGATDVGKTETAYAIAEHLFGHKAALLHINLNQTSPTTLADIKVSSRTSENRHSNLLHAISETPYAVVLLENIDQLPQSTFNLFNDILTQGYIIDEQGNKYDFRHAIIIMTTRCGAEHIHHLFAPQNTQETTNAVDLMQLVLSENLHEPSQHNHQSLSPLELCDEILPQLTEHFSTAFLQQLNIVPFIPLDYAALEKIVRLKVKTLTKRLDANFGIELSFAPEVIKFLAHEALWRKPNTKSLDKLLEQHLYACVAHEILLHADDKNKLKRLLVQLNDSGQLLRCEFITPNEAALYNL
ncbi:MAG: ATPase AAA-2 protein [uncultured bacterium]|nr:MAG: ATPase AAA-2 protein [uncultured bacterium]